MDTVTGTVVGIYISIGFGVCFHIAWGILRNKISIYKEVMDGEIKHTKLQLIVFYVQCCVLWPYCIAKIIRAFKR